MSEHEILRTVETKRSFGPIKGLIAVLLLGIPFLGRQHILLTDERIIIEQGFWTRIRDDIEIFRIRDILAVQTLLQRILGVGDVVIKSVEGRGGQEQVHVLRGVTAPFEVREAIRTAWNSVARPRVSTNFD